MGRYYSGDIEGKFWFGIQDSSAADRFGVKGEQPNYLRYWFEQEDLPAVEEELEHIKFNLGQYLEKIEAFFDRVDYYTDKELADDLGVEEAIARRYLSEYADYTLGVKIRDHLIEYGECEFDAEF